MPGEPSGRSTSSWSTSSQGFAYALRRVRRRHGPTATGSATRLALVDGAALVRDDLDGLRRDQAVDEHRLELGEDRSQAVLLVDDLDDDREVFGQPEDPGGVDARRPPEPLDA